MTDYSTELSGYKKYKQKDMISRLVKSCFLLITLSAAGLSTLGQSTVPLGIHYQAVARTSDGKEMCNKTINVMFTILSGSSVGTPVYQEVHNRVMTSPFGVFSLIIGTGRRIGKSRAFQKLHGMRQIIG